MLSGGGGVGVVDGASLALCNELTAMVMDSRGGKTLGKGDAGQLMKQANNISVHTVMAHTACLLQPDSMPSANGCCSAARVIEVWTLTVEQQHAGAVQQPHESNSGSSNARGLQSMFLKNAVRSHLHFSQLNAWIAENGGRMPDGIGVIYRLSQRDRLDADWAIEIRSHTFPSCDLDAGNRLTVTVQWTVQERIPEMARSCADELSPTSFDSVPEDVWLHNPDCSGSSLSCCSSSSNYSVQHRSPSPSQKQQAPQFFVSPDDDRYRSRARHRNHPSSRILMGGSHIVEANEVETLAEFFASATLTRTPRKDAKAKRNLLAATGGATKRPASSFSFNKTTGLPLNSSPAPLKRNERSFGYDNRLVSVRSTIYADDGASSDSDSGLVICKSAPASTGLLCNFEESALNGRLDPQAELEGFYLQLGSSGVFCPPHVTLPVSTFCFNLSDDTAVPSPYLGHCGLDSLGRRGYHIPKKGTLQVTLFNPQDTVVKMFVVKFDLSDMPASSQTFIRQRTFFMPVDCPLEMARRSWLRYLIHLRFATCRSGKLYLHTDIRMLFSRKSDLDMLNERRSGGGDEDGVKLMNNQLKAFELRTFTEMPQKPKYSPRK